MSDATLTASRLPYGALASEIAQLLTDASVQVPGRLVQALPGGGSLFVMPAHDARIAITKLITFTPGNAGTARPTIQGDVTVFDVRTGTRLGWLDGPTVTARRTAAVSLLAAQRLARSTDGPLLIVGAGVQGHAHLDAFADGLGIREVWVASRTAGSAQTLVDHALARGLKAKLVSDPNAAMVDCPMIVSGTPAQSVVLHRPLRAGQFLAAVGAFTPRMVELSPELCQAVARDGQIVVDTSDANHEAGDLLQSGLDVSLFPTLADVVREQLGRPQYTEVGGPILFKSCGWAGWDLAAARLAFAAGL